MIIWRSCPDGGFVVGDTVSGLTSYAAPTSVLAKLAASQPRAFGELMLRDEENNNHNRADFDETNWRLLEKGKTKCRRPDPALT